MDNHAGVRQVEKREAYIFFFLFILFAKIPYIKMDIKFVLSCRPSFFVIYYTINQIFKHCTIFARFCTICTKVYKNAFCTRI